MSNAPLLFFPGQIWTLKPPADPGMRVRVGAIESLGGRVGVHIEIAFAPLPDGFEAEDGAKTLSIGHVPIAATALSQAVDTLEASDAVLSRPFDEGFAAWRNEHAAGRAGFFDAAPHEIVTMLFEAMKQSSRPTLKG
jgi:hypothetical protein